MDRLLRLVRLVLFVALVRPFLALVMGLRVENRAGLPARGPAIVVANHNSHLDTLTLMALMPCRALGSVRPVAAADHFSSGIGGAVARHLLRAILIRRTGRAGADVLDPVVAALDRGEILILFPEGSRGEAEVMAPFKRGIAHIVRRRPEVPVIPVHLHGMGRCLPRASALFVPFTCTAAVGAPAVLDGLPLGDIAPRLQAAVAALGARTTTTAWAEGDDEECAAGAIRPASPHP